MRRGSALAVTPLMMLPVIVYNLFALTLHGGLTSRETHTSLTQPLLRLTTGGGGEWPVSAGDLMLAMALVMLFLELVKSSASRRLTLVNHGLSMLLFAICLGEMLLAPACATSTYFLITLMVLLDVLAGFMARTPASRQREDFSDVR